MIVGSPAPLPPLRRPPPPVFPRYFVHLRPIPTVQVITVDIAIPGASFVRPLGPSQVPPRVGVFRTVMSPPFS